MFAEEKPALLPLPLEPFRYYHHGQRVVYLDGCVQVEAAYYGLPLGWIGQLVQVQWDELFVRILDPKSGKFLREHVRQKRGGYRFQETRLQAPLFANSLGNPLSLGSVINRHFLPVLNRCEACGKAKRGHGAEHPYRRDGRIPEWHGWHAARRVFDSNPSLSS